MSVSLRLTLTAGLALASITGCRPEGSTRAAGSQERPRLVVVLVVDQMRADYLTRFEDLYRGGLARLRREGVLFTEAYVQHALTYTAPGHASVATGTHPSQHGVVENEWFDRTTGRRVYAAEDLESPVIAAGGREPASLSTTSEGRSPVKVLRPGLGDWLKRQVPRAKVFSVALKDRSSVMMGGQRPDRAYWFDAAAAGYVSSSWYGGAMPRWVGEFNASGAVYRRFAEGWSRAREPAVYARSGEDEVASEYDGVHTTLPHVFDDGTEKARASYLKEVQWTPFGDELNFAFVERLVKEEELGRDDEPDLLLVSCSSADYVGHRYGPMSHEMEDYYLRLDGYLGDFLAVLDKEVGEGKYVLALTADHGAQPVPEELAKTGQKSARRVVSKEYEDRVREKVGAAGAGLGLSGSLVLDVGEDGVWLDEKAAEVKGVGGAKLRQAVAEQLKGLDFVAETFTKEVLEAEGSRDTPFLVRYRRSYFGGRSPDVIMRFKEWVLADSEPRGTKHGSPYAYDTHVPVVFFGAGVRAGRRDQPVGVIDVAPTLADVLAIPVPPGLDGRSLMSAISKR